MRTAAQDERDARDGDGGRGVKVFFLGPSSASHVTRWVRHHRALGLEVSLGTMHFVPPEEDHGVVRLADRLTPGPTSLTTLLQAVPRARRALRTIAPDITCAYYMSSYGLLAALSGARPWVGAAAGGDVLVDPFDSFAMRVRTRVLLGITLARVAAMLAWAPHVADRLVELGVPRDRILVQPRGVNQALFRYREPRRRDALEPLRVLSIRWLKPLYRVDTLVRALGLLAARGVAFEARIGGDGPERPKLEALARELGITERVAFIGTVASDDVPEALAWCDAYVSTSSSDGASSSLFEALSVGAYPIVTDIVANRPFVDEGRTGALFGVGDHEALARALERVATDDALRVRAIGLARALVAETLDFDRNMTRIADFLARVARDGRARAAP